MKKSSQEASDETPRFSISQLREMLEANLKLDPKAPNLGVEFSLVAEVSRDHKIVDLKFANP